MALQDLMYRPPAFALDDVAALHAVMRDRVFATVAASHDGTLRFAYAPVVVDGDKGPLGAVRFHLAGNNPLSELPDGAALSFSMIASVFRLTGTKPKGAFRPGITSPWRAGASLND